jgi:hypothetical protein
MLASSIRSGKGVATLQGAITVADSNSSPEVEGVCLLEGPCAWQDGQTELSFHDGALWFGTPEWLVQRKASFPLGRAVRFLFA